MNTFTSKLVISGILSALTLISGIAVSQAGRPLNSLLFNLHKLISVATIILIFVTTRGLYKTVDAKAGVILGMAILTGFLFLAMLVTGGFLSFEIELPALVLRVHQAAPLMALASAALTVYLLMSRFAS